MRVSVRIPPQIGRLYQAQPWERVEAETMAGVVIALEKRFPGIGERLIEPDGQMRRWVNVFVDGQDIRLLDGMNTPLAPESKVYIVPAVAGG